jgi:hypothetical protein
MLQQLRHVKVDAICCNVAHLQPVCCLKLLSQGLQLAAAPASYTDPA